MSKLEFYHSVVNLHNKGLTVGEISEAIGLRQCAVRELLDDYLGQESIGQEEALQGDGNKCLTCGATDTHIASTGHTAIHDRNVCHDCGLTFYTLRGDK